MNQTEYHENLTKGFKTLGSRFDSFFIRSKLDLIKDNMAHILESQMTKRVIVKKNLKVRGCQSNHKDQKGCQCPISIPERVLV